MEGIPLNRSRVTSGTHGELVWRRGVTCESGACIEVAITNCAVMVRNSVNPGDMLIIMSHAEWEEFVAAVKGGVLTPWA
jgi:Domain of unknown function (DUF397)